jgi:hypothetical protein
VFHYLLLCCIFDFDNYASHVFTLLCFIQPSIAVRPNPVLFALPAPDSTDIPSFSRMSDTDHLHDSKENQGKSYSSQLPYRSLFAVLTWDSVLVYDTCHHQPLAVARGLHYAHLVDAAWTADGHTLLVCSTDGYISIIEFSAGELGTVYNAGPSDTTMSPTKPFSSTTAQTPPTTLALVAPCEPGTVSLVEPPTKRTRIAPKVDDDALADTVAASSKHHKKRDGAVGQASLAETSSATPNTSSTSIPSKKKKRIQPTLLS